MFSSVREYVGYRRRKIADRRELRQERPSQWTEARIDAGRNIAESEQEWRAGGLTGKKPPKRMR